MLEQIYSNLILFQNSKPIYSGRIIRQNFGISVKIKKLPDFILVGELYI